jgi:hypothetical protein
MDLNRDLILESKDLPSEEVDIPEWGGSVFVRTMTADERDKFDYRLIESKKNSGGGVDNVSALVAVMTVTDRNGNRMFTEADIVPLGRKSSGALARIWKVSQRLNALGPQAEEELAKN